MTRPDAASNDLVGGPFAVIESDPGVFTSLVRKLGVQNIELTELYDIEPWAVEHLDPHGLIFCFRWRNDIHRPGEFDDPAAERVWFANQLSDDACASHAILNVLLNCPHVEIGQKLKEFKQETEKMSPVMKGLAITNFQLLREAHNSLARPADIRGALNVVALATLDKVKAQAKESKIMVVSKRGAKPPPAKRAKRDRASPPIEKDRTKGKEKQTGKEEVEEAYHFIGYVPAYGKVWELDGLKSGPLEVGELPSPSAPSSSSLSPTGILRAVNSGWMDVARPALRMKMAKYGGAADGGDIRFSLLAIIDGMYEHTNDELQLLKREKIALERRMGDCWTSLVDPTLLETAQNTFGVSSSNKTFAQDFGSRHLEENVRILKLTESELIPAWETCVRNAVRANSAVEEEVNKAVRANTEHIKRTHDYEPFLKEFIDRLQLEGLLNPLLGRDEDGMKIKNEVAQSKP